MTDDAFTIRPHIIERWQVADRVEVAGLLHPEGGERTLLVFVNGAEAERFRRETGKYPAREGFEAVATDVEGLRNIIKLWGYCLVALSGLESDGGADFLDAETFCEILEDG
jgi:hypothetical protein